MIALDRVFDTLVNYLPMCQEKQQYKRDSVIFGYLKLIEFVLQREPKFSEK